MTRHHNIVRLRSSRRGFTTIELLVVIAIIATLIALTTAAVMKVLGKQPEKQTTKELIDLSEAADKFYAEFKIYPPSKMVLFPSRSNYNLSNPDHVASLAVLDTMFPTLGTFSGVDWTGAGKMPAGGTVLEGHQCLVFFLGGPNNQGFAKTGNPAAPKSAVPQRYGPYHEFKQNRLMPASAAFPGYMDPYSFDPGDSAAKPYLYFAPRYTKRYEDVPNSFGVRPYFKTATPTKDWYRKESCQIISAGRDRVFGTGGQWVPGNSGGIGAGGADDQSNFHDTLLGS